MASNLEHDGLDGVVYSDDQVLLLFGESEEGYRRARDAAQRAGCRVADEVPVAGGADRLALQVALDAALVVAETPSAELDRLLAQLDAEARSGRLSSVVVAPEAMIDAVTAHGFQPGIQHLIDPTEEELVIAVAMSCARAAPVLHDVSRPNGTAVLQQLSEEAARIANILASLSADVPAEPVVSGAGEAAESEPLDAAFVRTIIRARRLREQYFPGGLLGDPAWDMLLDLMAARIEGSRVAVSSLCIAAAVPATTALRWIKALTERGLFVRSADPRDGRRVYIELSEDAARAMTRYLKAARRLGITAI